MPRVGTAGLNGGQTPYRLGLDGGDNTRSPALLPYTITNYDPSLPGDAASITIRRMRLAMAVAIMRAPERRSSRERTRERPPVPIRDGRGRQQKFHAHHRKTFRGPISWQRLRQADLPPVFSLILAPWHRWGGQTPARAAAFLAAYEPSSDALARQRATISGEGSICSY